MSKPRILLAIIATLCVLTSIGIALYPTVSDYYYSQVHRHTISDYSSEVDRMEDARIAEMISAARKYNRKLLRSGKQPNQIMDEKSMKKYNSLLNVYGGGVMGYIRIPKIGVFLPIYHGTDESVLQVGAGHLASSSLPVGGKGTHSVITGHSGLRSAVMFTDLDKLVEGDTFTIAVLKDVLTYEVDNISVVLPDELDSLKIQRGKDYCTLVTCTPYGVNTHRLLVRGHRIETEQETVVEIQEEASEAGMEPSVIIAGLAGVTASTAGICAVYLWRGYRKKKKKLSDNTRR